MIIRTVVAGLVITGIAIGSATAQQTPATVEQRIALQLGSLVLQNSNQAVQIEQLQAELKAARERVKVLEDKSSDTKQNEAK